MSEHPHADTWYDPEYHGTYTPPAEGFPEWGDKRIRIRIVDGEQVMEERPDEAARARLAIRWHRARTAHEHSPYRGDALACDWFGGPRGVGPVSMTLEQLRIRYAKELGE